MFVLLATLVLLANLGSLVADGGYQLNKEGKTWSDAYEHCASLRSHLAYIESQADFDSLKELLSSNSVSSVHVGVTDLHTEGKYFSIKGDAIDDSCFDQWAAGAPTGGKEKNCGAFSSAGLTDGDCQLKKAFVCAMRDDYDLIEGLGWYKYHTVKANWATAVETCRSEGSQLLVVNSDAEVATLHDKYQYTWVWVGVHRVFADNVFITVTNEPLELTGFSQWRKDDPAGDSVTMPYVALQTTDGLYTSSGAPLRQFICKQQIH